MSPGRRTRAPFDDPRLEHDACGVGFVADAGGRSRRRVLPLALAGLAALGHRGAFAADGETSDGAGVALPLEPALRDIVAPGGPRDSAVLTAFLPRTAARADKARALLEAAFALEGLHLGTSRRVPICPDALGPAARRTRPQVVQIVVPRPPGDGQRRFQQRLLLARRRAELHAAAADLDGLGVVSCSDRVVIYKGLVDGRRLAEFYPDLATSLPVSHVTFHQRFATNTTPRWNLAQPFRRLAHNGEINTVRGNREAVRGRLADLRGDFGTRLRALTELGPLLSPGGSDSLSLDETVDLLVASGWSLPGALLALLPEAPGLRPEPHPVVASAQARLAGYLAPWDGPAAIVFTDGRSVGALLDRNGLRPAAYAIETSGLVALASEAGAVPLVAAETRARGRLGPGEMLLVEPGLWRIRGDAEAKRHALRARQGADRPSRSDARVAREASRPVPSEATPAPTSPSGAQASAPDPRPTGAASPATTPMPATPAPLRWLAGLDAERLRLGVRSMAIEATEPIWSMGDDTPTAHLSRQDRQVTDHLRQAFAQVTNPPIDPERERVVMDLAVELGRRPPLVPPPSGSPRTLRLARPLVAEADELRRAFTAARGRGRLRALDATWDPNRGPDGLAKAVDRLVCEATLAAGAGVELLVISDRRLGEADRLPVPSVLAAGAVNSALVAAGRRGGTDLLVEASDLLDIHPVAMALAAGATAVSPWLALEVAAEVAGSRGAEDLSSGGAVANLLTALEKALRKVLARMGISTAASYVGGQYFEALHLAPEVTDRCFPIAPAWPGRVTFRTLASRQLRRWQEARRLADDDRPAIGKRLPDPGFARYRSDGERHLYAPPTVRAMQALVDAGRDGGPRAHDADGKVHDAGGETAIHAGGEVAIQGALAQYREALARDASVVRDELHLRPAGPRLDVAAVEPASAIAHRFVGSAMSLGALSPEAHQAVTLGMQAVGATANTGEGGEDPAWYAPGDGGLRHDAGIKQVASARFGVTVDYLARARQLEIKMAQGSKPGEGGQLPARKVTPEIARLRRGRPGQTMISPPPHHDVYSIEDLAQLIADLRAVNPKARIGVKLVAALGVGTIAAGVAKAGADYIQISGHAGGTGASPLSSIKHAGSPWELGLAEAHQILLRNGLRDRVALRVDGGLQTGRDVVVAALLGAEEFGFGTALLVALGCDMARQCHLDTCPTGIATQRPDLRDRFTGRPEDVSRFVLAIAEDVRCELAALGLASLGDAIGRGDLLVARRGADWLRPLWRAAAWSVPRERRGDPGFAARSAERRAASGLEAELLVDGRAPLDAQPDEGEALPTQPLTITTAERSFGAALSGARARETATGGRRPPARSVRVAGAAGQSFGAFLGPDLSLELEGQANDYVGKGLSGGTLIVRPEPPLRDTASSLAIAGNTCLYGATAGRLHVVGHAGMRFGVRNSGARAVVEGIGPHGCEYMTGGVVVILGLAGMNLGAGMTGGRIFLHDPAGTRAAAVDSSELRMTRLAGAGDEAPRDAESQAFAELLDLLEAHRDAGSALAERLLADRATLARSFWLIEATSADDEPARPVVGADRAARRQEAPPRLIAPTGSSSGT